MEDKKQNPKDENIKDAKDELLERAAQDQKEIEQEAKVTEEAEAKAQEADQSDGLSLEFKEESRDKAKVRQTEAGTISSRSIVEEIEQSYLDYAMSVIISRALPDARDGLKPVHRKILYAMGEMNLTHNSKFTKSAKIVGEVMGKYHPHGDMAIYGTIVGMAQDFKMNYPLVDGQGNFGSMDGDGAAAPRYTEARLSVLAEEMLQDIDKETVAFEPNYDSTLTEPTVLPTRLPNLLLNGTVGIAVGMATNIPPHNLGELCDASIMLIDNPEASVDDLMQVVHGPDLPTGGTIHGLEGIKNAYATGKGKIVIRGEAEIQEDKRGFRIIVHSIPYQVNKADLILKIAQLVKDKKIEGITDLRDESDRIKSVRIVIELKGNAYPKKVLNRLYELTSLQTAFHINMLALVDRIQPRVLNLQSAIAEFIKHREDVVTRRTEFELRKAKERAHILEGLKKALDFIDEIIQIIKKSANREEAGKNLIAKFEFSQVQANAILDMRLSALAALERQRIEDELAEKLKLIEELTAILSDHGKLMAIIRDEIVEIKDKYAKPRKSKIIQEEIGSFRAEDLIPNESVVVTLTQGNYIKRVSVDFYKKQGRGGKGIIGTTLKDEDQVLAMETANTHDLIFFFTNQGKVYTSHVYDIPASTRQAKGQAIVNLIQTSPEEKVTAMLLVPKGQSFKDKYFMMATKDGVIKKTQISAYDNIRKTGLIAIKLKDKDELRFISITSKDELVTIVTKRGQGIVFKESEVRPMGRSAAGVIGVRTKTNDEVISMATFAQDIAESSKYELVTILENGFGKRTQITKHFPIQRRGGYGVRASKVSEKTGSVVEALITNNSNQDLILVSKNGQIIRIPLKSAKLLGRDTQGVRLMKLQSSDMVASVSSASTEEEEIIEQQAKLINESDNSQPVEAEKKTMVKASDDKATKIPTANSGGKKKSEDKEITTTEKKPEEGFEVHYYKDNER